jgi:hypothetical protein
MMTLFADTLMIATRMDVDRKSAPAAPRGRSPWSERVRCWIARRR